VHGQALGIIQKAKEEIVAMLLAPGRSLPLDGECLLVNIVEMHEAKD
jgi:hypothetical protein